MNDFSDLVPQVLIEFSISRAALRLTPELEREVAAAATEVGASPEAVELALWLLASPAAGRQPGPALPVLRFCAWFLNHTIWDVEHEQ